LRSIGSAGSTWNQTWVVPSCTPHWAVSASTIVSLVHVQAEAYVALAVQHGVGHELGDDDLQAPERLAVDVLGEPAADGQPCQRRGGDVAGKVE
jgi:hypothetical protein